MPFANMNKKAARPFFFTRSQVKVALPLLPLLLGTWAIFVLGLKSELNPLSDEVGYHAGGALLARSITNGTFLQDSLNSRLFKYPGYYALAGIIYFVFGESPLVLRFFGLIPFLGLPLLVANMASLVAGERARVFAMVAVAFSPVLFLHSMMLYRDIYIVFAVAIVLHATLQLQLPLTRLLSPTVVFAFLISFFFRRPQLYITLTVLVFTVLLGRALSFSRRWRMLMFAAIAGLLVASLVVLRETLVAIVAKTYFEEQQGMVTTGQFWHCQFQVQKCR